MDLAFFRTQKATVWRSNRDSSLFLSTNYSGKASNSRFWKPQRPPLFWVVPYWLSSWARQFPKSRLNAPFQMVTNGTNPGLWSVLHSFLDTFFALVLHVRPTSNRQFLKVLLVIRKPADGVRPLSMRFIGPYRGCQTWSWHFSPFMEGLVVRHAEQLHEDWK